MGKKGRPALWVLGTYLHEDGELFQGALGGHRGGAGQAGGGGGGVGGGGGRGGVVALLDQVWEEVDAARKAIPVLVLTTTTRVLGVVVMVAGGVVAQHGAGAGGKACEQAGALGLSWAGDRVLFVVTCTLEVKRGVDFGSRCVLHEFRGGEGIR